MRQTNSTLTFLAAQYRAVLKDAYLKGLASTAIVGTAVMGSMGSAHAADSHDTTAPTPQDFTSLEQLKEKGAKLNLTLSGGKTKQFEIKESQAWDADLVITDGLNSGPHQIKSAYGNKNIDLKGVGSLTVESSNNAVISIGENHSILFIEEVGFHFCNGYFNSAKVCVYELLCRFGQLVYADGAVIVPAGLGREGS